MDADLLSRRHPEDPEEDPEYQKWVTNTKFLSDKARKFGDSTSVDHETVCAVMQAKGINTGSDFVSAEPKHVEHLEQFVPAAEQLLQLSLKNLV